jgi:hypothetical protein
MAPTRSPAARARQLRSASSFDGFFFDIAEQHGIAA